MIIDSEYEGLSLLMFTVLIVFFMFIFGKKCTRIDLKNKKLIYHSVFFLLTISIILTMKAYARFFFVYCTSGYDLIELQVYSNQLIAYNASVDLLYYFDFVTILSETYFEYDFENFLQQDFITETNVYPVTFALDVFNVSKFKDYNSVVFDFLSIFIFSIFINTLIVYFLYFSFK
jgi:hypothetical protein